MKQFNAFKTLLFIALLSAASATVQAQNYHPLAFGTMGVYADPNWYEDYVGLNMICTAPASVGGAYAFTYPGTPGVTGAWGGAVTTPLVGDTLRLAPVVDSYGCSPFTPSNYFAHRIAVIWRGPEGSTACDFSVKAYYAQEAGAIAVILINEYAGEGPVGMAAGTDGSLVTIPVFQVGNIPGGALAVALLTDTVTFTITPWGTGLANNLGFVPGGLATWGNYAVPFDQMTSPSSAPYIGLDGAFVANFGTNRVDSVEVTTSLSFNGSVIRTGVSNILDSFPTRDSIWAMFIPNTYDVTATTAGRFDLTYNIIGPDIPTATETISFYASDSVYSKGTYDFTNNVPLSTGAQAPEVGGAAEDFVWGNMYYVNHHDGSAFSAVQFSLNNGFMGQLSNLGTISADVMVFRWIDGSNGEPRDSIVQNGELDCITLTSYNFQSTDTSGTIIKTFPLGQANGLGDTISGDYAGPVYLDDTSFYYVAVDVANGYSIYCDGQTNPYPRIFGHFYSPTAGYFDNSNIIVNGDYTPSTAGNPGVLGTDAPEQGYYPTAFAGSSLIKSVDSFNYSSLKGGWIPSIALITTTTPPPAPSAVKNVTNASNILNIYPIPTSDNLTVSLNLSQMSSTVTYTILDGLARFVSKQTHNNVTKEQFDIPTSNLAAGTYFLIVNANGKAMSRKFIVINK